MAELFTGEMLHPIDNISGLPLQLQTIKNSVTQEVTDRGTAITNLQSDVNTKDAAQTTALNAHKTNDFTPLKTAFDAANADETTVGSIRKFAFDKANSVKDEIINGATGIWQTLQGIQAYVEVNGAESITAAILAAVTDAKAELRNGVDSAMDTFKEVSDAMTLFATQTAEKFTNLETSLKAYADNAARMGGSKKIVEYPLVANGKFTLTNAPKDGLEGIENFHRVNCVVDGAIKSAYVTVDQTDTSGKTFIVSVPAGTWDGRQIEVQYDYIAAAV